MNPVQVRVSQESAAEERERLILDHLPQVRLIARRPLDQVINFRSAERGFLHRIFHAGIAWIAAYYSAEECGIGRWPAC